MVKQEIYEKVVEVSKKNDGGMTTVLTFGEEVVRVICRYGLQSGRGI